MQSSDIIPAVAMKNNLRFSMGHTYPNFKNPLIEGMLLRAIAWAGHYPVETLVNGTAPARGGEW